MIEILHVATLVLAAVGAGALVGARPRRGGPEVVAVVLMLVSMTDAMTVSLLPGVAWFAILLLSALALAARIRLPASAGARPAETSLLAAHTALGLVATAALILVMPAMPVERVAMTAAHAHGAIATMPLVLSTTAGAGTIALAAVALRARDCWQHRLHHSAMAASTVAMCAVVVS